MSERLSCFDSKPLLLLLMLSCTAYAQQAPIRSPLSASDTLNSQIANESDQGALFGDEPWRLNLEDQGIVFRAHYVGEVAGDYRATDYAQQLDTGLSLDLGRLGLLNSTILRLGVSERAGSNLASQTTGSYFQYQEIYGQGQIARLNEFTLARLFFGGRLSLKAGFYPFGNDFGTLPYTCNFTTNALCGHPLGLVYDSGWSDAPTGKWGGRARLQLIPALTLQVGVYESNPAATHSRNGFKIDFEGATGAIVPIEIAWGYNGLHPGQYKIGAYYDTSAVHDEAYHARLDHGREGFYAEGAQTVFKPQGGASKSGLSVFAVATVGDQDTALFHTYYELGASYRGLIPARPNDTIDIGWVGANINKRLRYAELQADQPVRTNEQITEANYGIVPASWLVIRPFLQYDRHPAALVSKVSALIIGCHIQVTF